MSKGDIILVPFPFTDLSGQKVRPALVLHVEEKGEDCIVAFLSSAKSKRTTYFDLSVVSSNRNGLKVNSVVKINKIATLQKKIALGQLGRMEPNYIIQINKKLKRLFGL
ncbi:MAG: hypothetical protein COX06_03325 [Candidatus Zambryskibacteria bacterium CG22_combo_CG10-13_8_21_14_all_42_17]|uniref:Growth inhibitor PemK n=1 Tax=Candidatus Zambryskibacteria bacterium CG22_combo_CG10-13_8_21_14_all_42_17 TaxID=1975118 RepID=A0A2H0BCX6_9BACT|nr:MAG: hypothetical protein COX06_03325 [Candidatus Zambryskibacteria bacterium CG22_combo_CG10-13_8_21_14_all_42_17]